MTMSTFRSCPWFGRTTVLTRQACFSNDRGNWGFASEGEITCHITMPAFYDIVFIACITIIANFHVLVFVAK